MMEKKKNYFWRNISRFVISKQNIVLFLVLLALFLVSYFTIDMNPNDNNVTWIFSSSMQTLAALIALLPISYSYYIHNMENAKKDDYDAFIIRRLQREVYHEMMFVIIYSLVVIVFNLFNLYLIYNMKNALITVFLTAVAIQFLVIYIYRLFDPVRVNNILMDLDQPKTKSSQIKVTLDEFITQYLNLETEVKDYISNENDNELVNNLPLYDIVDNLSKDFDEINKYYHTFKEIIYHRNNLIHNYHDVEVDYEKYERIQELIKVFQHHNQYFINKNIFASISSITPIVEKVLSEYLVESQNLKSIDTAYLSQLKEEICSLLRSYFVSQYYNTQMLDEATDADFEIVQNNYSAHKIVGIEIRIADKKKIDHLIEPFFRRLEGRYTYLLMINYSYQDHSFDIIYKTRDGKIKRKSVA